ncbi:hypothetical protein BO71DRAFT_17007 [Aspergillus ellipticus CBS 707.79]|uniref:Uncharacterized protein n=1 Tax=Aspergillus ellipticus CBS 707.79 TaxID=1448320 RepID=A0A319D628_9EURO|nr:hypothetical protein BO71DRAFT_17007 [Aspergillus ellipticus CBS 707.79]
MRSCVRFGEWALPGLVSAHPSSSFPFLLLLCRPSTSSRSCSQTSPFFSLALDYTSPPINKQTTLCHDRGPWVDCGAYYIPAAIFIHEPCDD